MARQGEQQTLGKRFARWFRRNEKLFWILLLVLVSMSFGATYLMRQVLEDRTRREYCQIDGAAYRIKDVLSLKRAFDDLAAMAPRLDYSRLILGYSQQQEAVDPFRDVLVPALAAVEEAKALGLEIPPRRVVTVAEECYRAMAALEERQRLTRTMSASEIQEVMTPEKSQEIFESIAWSPANYKEWVNKRGYSVRDFEEFLEMLLRIQLLREVFVSSDTISRKDIYENFVKGKRKLAFAFTALEPEQFVDAVAATPTQDEIEKYYREHRSTFVEPARVRFTYLKYPLSHFEEQVKLTDAQIREMLSA